jgi:predicted secreted Zn-dependent protease
MGTDFSSTDWQYYDVGGSTLTDAASSIEHLPEAGTAEWFPQFSYEADEHGKVTSVSITVGTRVTLPDWSGYSGACQAEKDEWDRFRAALMAHENGHLELVTTHLSGLDQHMTGGSAQDAQSAFEHALNNLKSASQSYDSQTNHGRSTGTIIDVSVSP